MCSTSITRSGFIQGRIQISKDLKQRNLSEEAMKGQELINAVRKVGEISLHSPPTQ
jgi:hypothetical protein